ncbi:SprT-like domain-containing protein [Niabella hibiscisoli]|uniref:SprT-like domain-containing protein n=1 Tax=Niabella hibiscisoli TaxID=1825928 RepID=UPI00374CC57D
MFDYYNLTLFANELPPCLINLSRRRNTMGFFAPERWEDKKNKIVHEISLNPDLLKRTIKEWHSTLVHEMAHLWQRVNGTASPHRYHNRIWGIRWKQSG